jgi:hypothetical protein
MGAIAAYFTIRLLLVIIGLFFLLVSDDYCSRISGWGKDAHLNWHSQNNR